MTVFQVEKPQVVLEHLEALTLVSRQLPEATWIHTAKTKTESLDCAKWQNLLGSTRKD